MGQEPGSMSAYTPSGGNLRSGQDREPVGEVVDSYDTGVTNPSPVVVGPSGVGPQSLGDADIVDVDDTPTTEAEAIDADTGADTGIDASGTGGTRLADAMYSRDRFGADIDSAGSGTDAADAGTEDPEEIRSQIEQTRSQMSETIDAIQEKLSPDNLKQQAQEVVREATVGRAQEAVSNVTETAKGFGSNMLETIKENPLPAAIAAIGIGWLISKANNKQPAQRARYYDDYRGGYPTGPDYLGYQPAYRRPYEGAYSGNYSRGYDDRSGGIGDVAGRAKDKVGDVAQTAGDTVGAVADRAGDTVGQVADTAANVANRAATAAGSAVELAGDQAQYRAEQATDWFQRSLRENPLAVGAVAAAVGAAIGLMLPETQQEHQMFGPARDNLMDKAQGVVQQTMDKVQRVAGEAADTIQQEAQNEGLAGQGSGSNQSAY